MQILRRDFLQAAGALFASIAFAKTQTGLLLPSKEGISAINLEDILIYPDWRSREISKREGYQNEIDELKFLIKSSGGLLNRLLVVKSETTPNKYNLVAGFRRLDALRLLGPEFHQNIPVEILPFVDRHGFQVARHVQNLVRVPSYTDSKHITYQDQFHTEYQNIPPVQE